MPRISRKSYDGQQVFHVMTQGINKENIFKKDSQKREYIKLMCQLKKEFNVKIISYCIMDNHSHAIIQIKSIENMTKFMHILNTKYGIYYNKSLKRVGYVFRDRFKVQPILNIQHLYNCIIYVHNNPVNAGKCIDAKQYNFSSYHLFAKENKKIFYRLFKNIEEYQLAHMNHKKDDYFMEDENDIDYMMKTDISSYLALNNKRFVDLKVDKELLIPIAKKMKKVYKVSNRKIAKYFNVSSEKIRYILK